MPLSKEFYLDEIRSKYPNSYNESLKDLPVKDLEDMLDFLEGALEKADGGSIGIEVLFGPKRDEFSIGGKAKKSNKAPYDPRASILDYGAALDKVGAGTQAQKSQSLGQYAKNFFSGLGEAGLKQLNPAVRGIASFYGAGKPISKFDDFGRGTQQAIQGAILRTLKDPNAKFSKTNIPVSSYQSYFKDKPTAQKLGVGIEGYDTFGAQLKDMAKALAGNQEAIARMTLGRFNLDIDPEARTASLRDVYNFSNKMPFGGGKEYGINMALPQSFVDEILKTSEYQKLLGPQYPDYLTAARQAEFYKNNPSFLDSDMFRAAYARALPNSGIKTKITNEGRVYTDYGNYDPSNVYAAYMSDRGTSSSNPFFDQFKGSQYADMPAIMKVMYGAPGNLNPYYADGGRVGLFMGGPPLEGTALSIYNSMSAYGFSDQEIADALQEQGLYTPGATTEETGIIASAPNIINQQTGGGGDGPPPGPTFNRNDLLGTPDYFPAEPFSFSNLASDIADYVKSGGIFGAIGKGIKGLFSRNVKNYVTTPQLKARDRLEAERKAKEEAARQEVERQAAFEQARKDRDAAVASGLDAAIREGRDTSGFDRPSSGAYAEGAGMGVGGGYASDFGFKKGGLATMFKKKR